MFHGNYAFAAGDGKIASGLLHNRRACDFNEAGDEDWLPESMCRVWAPSQFSFAYLFYATLWVFLPSHRSSRRHDFMASLSFCTF